jgi:antitoxin ParD1/3/4
MATMNVSLPDAMKDWVEAQVRGGKYANASDYVRDLIRRDQTYEEKLAVLRAEIREGDESQDSPYTVGKIFDQVAARKRTQRRA